MYAINDLNLRETQMIKRLAILTIVLLVVGTLLSPFSLAGLFEAIVTACVLLFVGVVLMGVFTGVGLVLAGALAFAAIISFVSLLPIIIPLMIPLIVLWMLFRLVKPA